MPPSSEFRRQLFVRGFFFVERLLQPIGRVGVSHRACPRHQRAVSRHLVMLRPLTGGNQARVHVVSSSKSSFHHRLCSFLDDAGDAVAMLAARLLAKTFEDLFKPLDVSVGLFQMRGKGVAQRRRRCRLGQLRKGFGQLAFAVVCVAEFVDERVVQRVGFQGMVKRPPGRRGESWGDKMCVSPRYGACPVPPASDARCRHFAINQAPPCPCAETRDTSTERDGLTDLSSRLPTRPVRTPGHGHLRRYRPQFISALALQ